MIQGVPVVDREEEQEEQDQTSGEEWKYSPESFRQ